MRMGKVGRVDNGDGKLSIWNVAWVARALVADPRHVFDANIFYPHRGTLAYSENNLGAGVLAIPAYWLTRNPYAALNSAMLLGFILSAAGAYYLVRYLTRDRRAAIVVGDPLRVLPVRLRAHGAHPAADDRRPAVRHAGVPSADGSADARTRQRARGGDGGAGDLLRLLRRLRDPDGRLRLRHRRHGPRSVDRREALVVHHHGRRCLDSARRAGVPAVRRAESRRRLPPRSHRGRELLGELERLPRERRVRARVDAAAPAALDRGLVSRLRRDRLRNRRRRGVVARQAHGTARHLRRVDAAGVLGVVRSGEPDSIRRSTRSCRCSRGCVRRRASG